LALKPGVTPPVSSVTVGAAVAVAGHSSAASTTVTLVQTCLPTRYSLAAGIVPRHRGTPYSSGPRSLELEPRGPRRCRGGMRTLAVLAALALLPGCDGSERATAPSEAEAAQRASFTSEGGAEGQRPRGVRETCSTRSEADFPGARTDPDNLVVGPLILVGAGRRAHYDEVYGGQKFQALVRNGRRVTVEVPRSARPGAGLAYGPLPRGEVDVSDTHRVVRFLACRRGRPSGSSASGRSVTFWSGGVLAQAPRCVPLRIWVGNEPSPRQRTIRLGVKRCT
jgi:hypothetical protein